jgi:hypothetical protein
VHPDKNMGSPLASESFKKLQCAYEVSAVLYALVIMFSSCYIIHGCDGIEQL